MKKVKPDLFLRGRGVFIDKYHLDGVDSYTLRATWADTLLPLTNQEMENLDDTHEAVDYYCNLCLENIGYYE